jgi:hypothetical protein
MKILKNRNWLLFILLFHLIIICPFLLWPQIAASQENPSTSGNSGGFFRKNVKLTGDIGTYGELYDMSGRENRRPGSTGRLFFRPTVSFYNSFSISANILLSTEGKTNRQNINQLDFNPSWRWGYAHLGDFTESYSSLTLSGINVRGGSVSINPGKFRFSTIVGQTRRATSNSSANRSYSREIYGGRIGLGRKTGSFVDLIILKAKDKAGSLPALSDSTDIQDSTQVDIGINRRAVAPKENLVTAISSNLELFKKKLIWKNELGGSAFTRNTQGQQLSEEDVPSWANKIFKVRIGSRVDVAYKTKLDFEGRKWSLSSGYEFIGPGYISLGMASSIADKQGIYLGGSVRGRNWSIRIAGARENDNLINQKANTTNRSRINTTINYRPLNWWNSTLSLNMVTVSNDADNDTVMINNSNFMLGLNQVIAFSEQNTIQNISVNYIVQTSADKNPLRNNTRMRSHTVDFRTLLRVSKSVGVTPAIMVNASSMGSSAWSTTSNYNLNIQYRAMAERFISNLAFGPSFSGHSKSFRANLTSTYKITTADYIQSDIKYNHFKGSGASATFDEYTGNVAISHRF